jgi:hypothetical protein
MRMPPRISILAPGRGACRAVRAKPKCRSVSGRSNKWSAGPGSPVQRTQRQFGSSVFAVPATLTSCRSAVILTSAALVAIAVGLLAGRFAGAVRDDQRIWKVTAATARLATERAAATASIWLGRAACSGTGPPWRAVSGEWRAACRG